VESPYLYDDPIKIFFNVNGVPYVYPTETDQAGAAREMSVASYPVSINDQPYRVKFRIITPKMTNFVSEYVSNELMTVKEVPSGVQSYRLFSKEGSASHYNNKLSAAVRFEITY
jgi:hypothetical protein